jgi:hypothetical protein
MTNKRKTFMEKGRSFRESKGILLRQVAAKLEVNITFLGKQEGKVMKVSMLQGEKLVTILNVGNVELFTSWLSEKLLDTMIEDGYAFNAIKLIPNRMK